MHISFAMWRKASWEPIKMDDKREWDTLDVISRWLIATRSAVTTVTIYSCIIAHGTNHLLNDYTDYSRGIDKDNYFRKKGVGTFPVRVGQTPARHVNLAAILIAYVVVLYLVIAGYFSTFMLLILFAAQRALYAVMVLSKPRPEGPPQGFEAFRPTWFSGFCFYHNRAFGGLFILGALLDTIFRKLPMPIPLYANWMGAFVLVVGLAIAVVRMLMANGRKT